MCFPTFKKGLRVLSDRPSLDKAGPALLVLLAVNRSRHACCRRAPFCQQHVKGHLFFSFSALYTYCIAHLFCIFTCKVLPFLLKPCSAVTRSLNVVPCKKRRMSPQIFVFNFNLFFRKQTSWRFLLGCLQSRGSIKLPFM